MKRAITTACAVVSLAYAFQAPAQVAGQTQLGVSVTELETVIRGVSVKRQVLGKPVYNEADQKVGSVVDLIVAPDKAVSFAIVGAGGFVGLGRHDVAIPVSQFKFEQKKIVLPGATKDAVKALPPFDYAKK
ncbi:PRC-barrel domain-containing protein [Cupriavidus malaysiensis]|uniref:Photosystem reaction center subunit H n=1 Tax=Cupriavidus malaysiensis TaxID=367825 RepID=A0ABM6FFK8_9BURK|nr:PRC-barrel domain-containing protein [Cupriavidus malaysiensis]AOZ10583.1 photosystem reaction center subunit H [Cupriavidus malaysiensis]